MPLSAIGNRRLITQAVLFFINIVVLALAARVNIWQEFFFVADLLPFALSILTMVLLTFCFFLDATIENPFTGRAPFEIGYAGALSVIWLVSNSFSTSRWRHIPLACNSISKSFAEEIAWCKNVQALKSFIWIEWLILLFHTLSILRFAMAESKLGNKHVWTTSLARYTPHWGATGDRSSEFLQFEKL